MRLVATLLGMRPVGVNYDTGLRYDGRSTRTRFDAGTVRDELRIIANDLHAPAVRVSGNDPDRLVIAGEAALEAGLDLWFSPVPMDLEPDEFIAFLADCGARAETLRQSGRGDVVLVLGCELSVFCKGFVPGETSGSGFRRWPIRPPGPIRRRWRSCTPGWRAGARSSSSW